MHSNIVGGSTAKRVLACPGSVVLCQKMPPQPSSKFAEEGTMLHDIVERLVNNDDELSSFKESLTEEQYEKLAYAINALDVIDPKAEMIFKTETKVEFEGVKGLENCFGTIDMLGCLGDRAIILDWKFGDGVMVGAEENEQGLFYAAAAMRTAKAKWAFEGAKEIEIIIVQPPRVSRWVTTWARVAQFERDLINAVKLAMGPDAPIEMGEHCRWCAAKPICPKMTGAIDRLERDSLKALSAEDLGRALQLADKLESFIKDARALAVQRLEKDMPVAGYKLVSKRPTRQWAKPQETKDLLLAMGAKEDQITELLSPAQMEKALKKTGLKLPDDHIVAVSSGSTLAPEDDPRPAVLNIGKQLSAALSKLG